MRIILSIFCIALLVTSCDTGRIAERNVDIEETVWHPDSIKHFEFEIPGTESYNVYLNLRNKRSYPFHNIYLAYTLKDSTGAVVANKTEEFLLFEPKTGQPLGEGFGDIQSHQFPILENFSVTNPGFYSLEVQHYMRPEILDGILSVGFRLENAENGS